MIEVNVKNKCCGCGACKNICPNNCIEMVQDEEGFQYPCIDATKCVDCGLCSLACPFIEYSEPIDEISDTAYAVQYCGNNNDVLEKCASGGAFTAFSEAFLRNGGVVVGASYDENWVVRHSLADNTNASTLHSGSKYVQSDMGLIMRDTKQILESGKNVLFSGTPCQIVALKKFLRKDYSNLFTVDIICAGVSSPRIFSDYIFLKKKELGGELKDVNFKYKKYGYHSSVMSIKGENNKSYQKSRLTDEMMRVFCAYIAMRPSCGDCVVKGKNRYSDLSLFDCWNFNKLTKKKDNDRGHTSVIVHSKKGIDILKSCEDLLHMDIIDLSKAIEMDGNTVKGAISHSDMREKFFNDYYEAGLTAAISRNIPILIKDHCMEIAKPVLYKSKLMNVVRKFK